MEIAESVLVPSARAARALATAIKRASHVYLCGNGGSAANAIHLANDFISCGVRAHALSADIATLTAIANDYSYDEVFSRQVETLGTKDDLLIALSGSGSSINIWCAIEAAIGQKMSTWAIYGDFCHQQPIDFAPDKTVRKGKTMQEAEEYQLALGHKTMRCLKNS